MAKKPTCPICMTKLKPYHDGHTKICPECGYKLCDHAYENRKLYDTDHTHSDYTTYNQGKTTYSSRPVQTSPAPVPNRPNTQPKKKEFSIPLLIIVVVFILFRMFGIF